MGSNIVLTDDNQNVLVRYEYDVFGAIRSEVGTTDNVRKFTGKEWDADINLYYYAARYYDPYVGRFTQRDPAQDGINWYAYANNNPLAFIDPSGLRAVNSGERDALIWTFGQEVGESLANIIDVRFEDLSGQRRAGYVPAGSSNIIMLDIGHDSEDVYDLSIFIHEATHIWQKRTGLHRDKGDGDYQYTHAQLQNLDLSREEHAEAVQDWFFVTWGLRTGEINVNSAWKHINSPDLRQREPSNPSDWHLLLTVEQAYANVLNEIRDPDNLPRQRQQYTRSRLAQPRRRRR